MRSTKSAEDATDEMEMANVVIATAKKTLITQVVKKNVMENVIPLVLSLKHVVSGLNPSLAWKRGMPPVLCCPIKIPPFFVLSY